MSVQSLRLGINLRYFSDSQLMSLTKVILISGLGQCLSGAHLFDQLQLLLFQLFERLAGALVQEQLCNILH